jgi:ferritin-like metal-binding protein YciE
MDNIDNYDDLLSDGLIDLNESAKEIISHVPSLILKANSQSLKQAMVDHLVRIRKQQIILDLIIRKRNIENTKEKISIKGIIEDSQNSLSRNNSALITDTIIAMTYLKIEQYEMTSYNFLIKLANQLGEYEISELLSEFLSDEKKTHSLFMSLIDNDTISMDLETP